ncbi:MAG: methyltransferase domain-containing protein [Candidatus Wallbacteria bacterium]|nr:methyltransferase domain-containing protein [Candidatus Wallbacteria bacterium]
MALLSRLLAGPRSEEKELLDGPLPDRRALLGNLRDLAWVNRWAGGTAVVTWALDRLLASSTRRSFRVLDVGTGGADIPVALAEWGRRRGLALSVDAIDLRPEVVELAQSEAASEPAVSVRCGDALALDAPDGAYDFVISSLALHHLSPSEAVAFLSRAHRAASHALIVNDLRRSRTAWLGTRLIANAVFSSTEAKFDGPLSVLRAYTPEEVGALAARAGLPCVEVHRRPPFRLCLIARKRGQATGTEIASVPTGVSCRQTR